MGYLSCRAESSTATCRSISALSPLPAHRQSYSPAAAAAAVHRFEYSDVESATGHFSDAALLGRGSHASVYKASLPGLPFPVAVKRPSPRCPPAAADAEAELAILSSVRSPRFVNLLGVASRGADRLLVVEYMPNGTLFDLLHSNPRPPAWPRRLRLALHTAKALRALHSAQPPVVHRDVKSANVLLDADFHARLADFGLAVRASDPAAGDGGGPPPRPPAGTLGYLDPAYVTPENLSTKTDVFSFGILLFEIVSGRKAIDVSHSPPSVVEWAVPLLRKGKIGMLFDPRIPPPRDAAARRQLAALACACVRPCIDKRPTMADVVEQLKQLCRTAASRRAWSGLAAVGNPCAVVDVEKTIAKISITDVEADADASPLPVFDEGEEECYDSAAEELPLPSPPPMIAGKKTARPLRNARVFSEAAGTGGAGERRNLLELMARIDGMTKFSNQPGCENSGSNSPSNQVANQDARNTDALDKPHDKNSAELDPPLAGGGCESSAAECGQLQSDLGAKNNPN